MRLRASKTIKMEADPPPCQFDRLEGYCEIQILQHNKNVLSIIDKTQVYRILFSNKPPSPHPPLKNAYFWKLPELKASVV